MSTEFRSASFPPCGRNVPLSGFDFGLGEDEERRAARLHSTSLVIDLLYQGPIGPLTFTQSLDSHVQAQITRNRAARCPPVEESRDISDLFSLVSAPVRLAIQGRAPELRDHWARSGVDGGNREIELSSLELYANLMGLAQRQFDSFPWMTKALRAADFHTAKKQGKFAGFISTQLVTGAFPSLCVLEHAWEAGLRMAQLTYNGRNELGCGCTYAEDSGLTRFGKDAVRLMNEIGLVVDTAHSGRRTTLDACEVSSKPVVASHSAAAGLYDHERCKSDDELDAIAATGGVIGVVAVPFFLAEGDDVTINAMLDHIDYVSELVGSEHVAIGTDWPNQLPFSVLQGFFEEAIRGVGFREDHKVDATAVLDGFGDYLDFPNITRGLVSRGYSDVEIEGILGENFLRVFAAACG